MTHTDGLITCTRYAFPPNALSYCGPDRKADMHAYRSQEIADRGLKAIIEQFETLYPYLHFIAYENNIRDPFDPRVVEAYWIGNRFLSRIAIRKFYGFLKNTLNLRKKLKKKDLELIYGKLDEGMLPHHNFHVCNIFTRTGHHSINHTLDSIDACRIAWGTVLETEQTATGTNLRVKTNPLVLERNKLKLGKPIIKTVFVPLESAQISTFNTSNTMVSFHWDTLCGILTGRQAFFLQYYTLRALALANKRLML